MTGQEKTISKMKRTSGDLGVKVVLLRDLADRDELVGRDFASGHPRDDAEGAVALDVGEEPVVGILEAVVLRVHDVLVVQRREDAAYDGLADFATLRVVPDAGRAHDRVEVLELLDLAD